MLGGELGCFRCSSFQRRDGKPPSLSCGFATRRLSPGPFCKGVELCSSVVCLLGRSGAASGIALCVLYSRPELGHLLLCCICLRTTLLRCALCLRYSCFVLGGEVGCFRRSSLQRRN